MYIDITHSSRNSPNICHIHLSSQKWKIQWRGRHVRLGHASLLDRDSKLFIQRLIYEPYTESYWRNTLDNPSGAYATNEELILSVTEVSRSWRVDEKLRDTNKTEGTEHIITKSRLSNRRRTSYCLVRIATSYSTISWLSRYTNTPFTNKGLTVLS